MNPPSVDPPSVDPLSVANTILNPGGTIFNAGLGLLGIDTNDATVKALNFLLGFFKNFLVFLLRETIMPLLTNVMSYQNFFSTGVNAGWEITRNFSNLFFALILLIIAIATVLQVGALDNYTAKRMLPNFIFVALFINFSKAIVGFLIDISQIIMISFYNSFGPNISNIIGNAAKLAESAADTTSIDNLSITIFTIVIVLILTFVILWTILILAMRIVTLWFIIMLSPLAFMATLVPGLKSISDDWKNRLQDALVTGPTLMFFLYLAFTVMNNGISINNVSTGNLMNNGNLINYVLVIVLLLLANSYATKAGQAAPPFLQKAVGVAGTVATFGLGAYVGAGGYGTGQLVKKTTELTDKGIGGATRTVQVASGGKVKLNSKYEAMKKDMKAKNDAGKGLFGGVGQQFSKEGREEQQKDFELKKAREYAKSKAIDDPTKKRYKKVLLASMAEVASEIKDQTNAKELGKQYVKALEDGEVEAAAAIAAKISTLENGWDEAQTVDAKIFNESRKKKDSQEQMRYIFDKSFGELDQNSSIITELKSRMTNNLRDKGQGSFADGLTPLGTESSSEKALKGGLSGVSNVYAKNKSILNRRVVVRDPVTRAPIIDPTTGDDMYELVDNKSKYELDPEKIYQMLLVETNIDNLKDRKVWNVFGSDKPKILKVLQEIKDGTIPTPGGLTPDSTRINAALEGLGEAPSNPNATPWNNTP
jgi:hypothetical protein